MSETRRMTPEEHEQGWYPYGCGVHAHVFRADVLRKLPPGYSGEFCTTCDAWVVPIAMLIEGAKDEHGTT